MGDRASVKALLAFFTGSRPLRGVFHAAGVLDDGILSGLTPQRLEAVYRPKVNGAWHLHNSTKSLDLDFFVVCSSLSGIIGNPGQANYAAANTFLDALAHGRRSSGLPGTAVSFGLWAGSEGMGARLGEAARTRFAEEGLSTLEPTKGLELIEQVVSQKCPHAVAAAYNFDKLKIHLLEDLCSVPPFFRTLLGNSSNTVSRQRSPSPKSKAHEVSHNSSLRTRLAAADRGQHEQIVLDAVRGKVARVLGFTSMEDVDVDQPLPDIDVDSLTAIVTKS